MTENKSAVQITPKVVLPRDIRPVVSDEEFDKVVMVPSDDKGETRRVQEKPPVPSAPLEENDTDDEEPLFTEGVVEGGDLPIIHEGTKPSIPMWIVLCTLLAMGGLWYINQPHSSKAQPPSPKVVQGNNKSGSSSSGGRVTSTPLTKTQAIAKAKSQVGALANELATLGHISPSKGEYVASKGQNIILAKQIQKYCVVTDSIPGVAPKAVVVNNKNCSATVIATAQAQLTQNWATAKSNLSQAERLAKYYSTHNYVSGNPSFQGLPLGQLQNVVVVPQGNNLEIGAKLGLGGCLVQVIKPTGTTSTLQQQTCP